MKKLWVITTILFSVLVFPFITISQDQFNYDELDDYITKSKEMFDVPGFAVGIIKDGDIVFKKGYGFRNTETKEEVDAETIFGIASCSKAFTTACLGILVDDGIINWDDKVIDHFPGFKMYDPYITKEMQIQDLVCHRSGLQTFDGDLLWYGSDYTRKEVVNRIQYRENPYSLRSQFGYQNVMFIIAGEVIENVSGKTWDEFVKERIFDPLGMVNSSTTNSHFNESMNIAYPHIDSKPEEFLNYDNCGPAASINTTINELLKWVQLMLNKGVYNSDTIFTEDQYYKLTKSHTILNAGPVEKIGGTHFYTYGLGWFMFDYEGRKIIQHGGGLPGFHSKVVFVPEDSLGYVILSNQISGMVEATHRKILDFFVSDSDKNWAELSYQNELSKDAKKEEKKQKLREERIKGTEPTLKLKEYTGLYKDKMYGKAEIKLDKGQLHLTLLPSKQLFVSEMEHWQNNTFRIEFNDPFLPEGFVTFKIDRVAGVDHFTIDLENPDFHFYKLKFEKVE